MAERIIFHIDVNSAFLSWEAVERLKEGERIDLRTIPSAVGGDMATRHGVVVAKSIPAKKYNIVTGEPVINAMRKCPNLIVVSPRHDVYKRYSKAFMDILREYSDIVEQYSIDEAFVDMTGTRRLFGEPLEAAQKISNQIKTELGFTVNIGISTNKLLAKMASDFKKPDRVHTLFPNEISTKMWPLKVGDLFFAGKSTVKILNSIGIRTIGELANTDKDLIVKRLKKHGDVLWRYANGLDDSPVEPVRADNKGYGNSITMSYDVTQSNQAKEVLLWLTEKVCQRLRSDGFKAESVTVFVKYSDFTKESHQCTLVSSTDITQEIYRYVCKLFDEMWDETPIRLLGVSAGKVSKEETGRQLELFDTTDYSKLEKLDKAMDDIRKKYGQNAIKRASLIEGDREKNE
ncbi:MAG: DNA polymerase IV [Agathobacter sp.]|nr:DNA polymerase IV [Agathobacter sp.]